MIFVTVGTHEQSFIRLIKKIDELKGKGIIKDDVFMQIGYTKDYIPKHCDYKELITCEEMDKFCTDARIIITHGGPGSIMLPFKMEKVPIVVPRNPKYNEHIDEHQMLFSAKLKSFNKIIEVLDIDDLEDIILNYEKYASKCYTDSNNRLKEFVKAFEYEVEDLMSKIKRK